MNDHPLHPDTDDEDEVLVHRLRAELGRRAADAAVPEAGYDLVHGRIRRRHRNRRLLVGGGALVVVLALLLAGLGAMARDDERSVVDTGGTTMPFFGFENDTWVVVSYAPGLWYGVVDDMGQPSDEAVQLLVSNDAAVNEPFGFSRVRERTLENMRGDLLVGRLEVVSPEGEAQQGGPAVWWSPVPGWTATLTGNSPEAFADADALLAAADAVVDVDRATWEAHLRSEGGRAPLSELPALVLPPPGRTQVLNATQDNVAMWLEPGGGLPEVMFNALGPGTQWSKGGAPEPVEVRGTTGRVHREPAGGDPTLSWTEGDRTYVLLLAPGMTDEQAIELAEQLTLPTPDDWERLLFPPEPQPYPEELLAPGAEPSATVASGGSSSP